MIAKVLQSLPQSILDQIPDKAHQGYNLAGRGILQIVETVEASQEPRSDWEFFYRTLEDYEHEAAGGQPDNIDCIRRYRVQDESVVVTLKRTPAMAGVSIVVDFDVISLVTLESLTP